MGVNSADDSVSIYLKEQAGGYPSLTTTNLLTMMDYMSWYYVHIQKRQHQTLTSYSRKMISNDKGRVDTLDDEIFNHTYQSGNN